MYGAVNQRERMSYHNGRITSGGNLSDVASIYSPRVQLGDVVVVKYLETDEERAFLLLGDRGGSFDRGVITVEASIGSAVFSKPVGRILAVRTPGKIRHIQIIDIRKPC